MTIPLDDLPDDAITMIRVMSRRGYRVRICELDGARALHIRHHDHGCPESVMDALALAVGADLATSSSPRDNEGEEWKNAR